jgi:methyl-accepting chemotaxis protein
MTIDKWIGPAILMICIGCGFWILSSIRDILQNISRKIDLVDATLDSIKFDTIFQEKEVGSFSFSSIVSSIDSINEAVKAIQTATESIENQLDAIKLDVSSIESVSSLSSIEGITLKDIFDQLEKISEEIRRTKEIL